MTFDLFKAVKVSADMIERRDFVRRIYGDKYQGHVASAKQIVKAISERDDKPILAAALWICEKAMRDGHGESINMVIAAAVELCEEMEVRP